VIDLNEEWVQTLCAVIDTNMDLIEQLDTYEQYRDDKEAQTKVRDLERFNKTLREHLVSGAELTPAEMALLGSYTATAKVSYLQKKIAITKMLQLCDDIIKKISDSLAAENPGQEFAKKFSEKLDMTIN